MLSALTTSLLPESVASLFDPPLDSRQLHLSLLTGRLQLTDLRLHADRCSALLLPPPAAPLRVQSGRLRELELGVDWKNLFSQPFKLVVKGLHLRLEPAPVPAGLEAQKGATTQAPATASSKFGAAATPQVEWKEEDLLRVAVERKLLALEAAAPLHVEGEKGQESGGGGSTSTGSSWLKKLVTFVLNSLHAEISDVSFEIDSEGAGAGEEPSKAALSRSTQLLSSFSTDEIHAAHMSPVKIGLELKQCMVLQAVKIDRPVASHSYNSTKEMALGVAVYCDVGSSAHVGASSECVVHAAGAPPVSEDEQKAGVPLSALRAQPKGATSTPTGETTHVSQAAHDYILQPSLCELFMAFQNNIGSTLELQARLLTPLIKASAHPAQVAAICSLLASILRHQAAVQREVDRVGGERFRSATSREADCYQSLVAKAMRGQKLDSWQQRSRDHLERVLTLKDLALMRHSVRSRLHEKQLHDEQLQSEAEQRKLHEESGAQAHEAESHEPSMWQSMSSYFSGLVAGGEERLKAVAPGASDEKKTASSGPMQQIGKLQSTLDEATPFDLDVQFECEAESVSLVLFADSNKSEQAALLALRLHDGALCVDTDPGGAVDICAGVRQLNLIDVTRPQDRLPTTYFRLVPSTGARSVIKPEKPKSGNPFELLPMEFYRAMPLLLSGSLLPTKKAVSSERQLQSHSPSAAAEEVKTAHHLNELELAVSGVQAQLLLTLATKLGQVPALLQACAQPLSSLPPAPQPPSEPELQPKGTPPLEMLAALLPMRIRLNIGGERLMPYLGEEPPAQSIKQPAYAPAGPSSIGAGAPARVNEAVQTPPRMGEGARWCVYL